MWLAKLVCCACVYSVHALLWQPEGHDPHVAHQLGSQGKEERLVNPRTCLNNFPQPQTGVPQFLQMMHDAVKGYPDYLKAEGKEWLLAEADKFWGHQER